MNGSRSASYASHLLEGTNNRILFTGYLDEESPGKGLLNALVGQSRFTLNGRECAVRADVQQYHLSAHPSLARIVELVERVHPKNAVFVHGHPSYTQGNDLYRYFHQLARKGIQPHVGRSRSIIAL